MKKFTLLMLLAGALACQVTAAPDVTLRVTPERDSVYTVGSREVIIQIDLDGRRPETGRRAPMNLAVVLDRSGSMQGAKIEKARQAANVALDHLADEDWFSLVIYDNDTQVLIPPSRVGDRRHREELKARIDSIRPGGGTALHAGVTLGAQQVRKHIDKEFVNRVILLSDGLANVGPSRTSDLVSLGRSLRSEGLSVSTIGLGDDYNEDLMTALAESSSANYYYVRDAEKLPGIFSEELGLARTMVARGISIRITAPTGVRLKEIIGRPEITVSEREAVITLPEYFGAEKRRFHVRCEVDGKVDDKVEVANVDLKYERIGGGEDAQKQAAAVTLTDDKKKSDASIRVEVFQEVAVLNNRLSKERAVMLADQGRAKEAAEVLSQQIQQNNAALSCAPIPQLLPENKNLQSTADELTRSGGLEKGSRKQMQYENYQDKYQKR